MDGSNDYVSCGTLPNVNINDRGTIALWIKPDAWSGFFSRSVGTTGIDQRTVLRFWYDTGIVCTNFADGTNYAYHTDGHANSLSTWIHVAETWDGTWLKHYINGSKVATSYHYGLTPDSTGVKTWLGRMEGYSNPYFDGVMDELYIYDRVLSAAEISALYNSYQQ